MANLRADLLNELRNQKYYAEIELVRLAQDGTMNYREKIDALDVILGDIAIINQKMALADGYFAAPEAAPEAAPAPAADQQQVVEQPAPEAAPAPAPQPTVVHQGQSHGE